MDTPSAGFGCGLGRPNQRASGGMREVPPRRILVLVKRNDGIQTHWQA
jgi:hypothetical protein